MKKTAYLAMCVVIVVLLAGCGGKEKQVLARIDDEVITLGDFNEKIERLPSQYQEMVRGQKKRFLDELIKEQLLYSEALASGVEKDAETQEIIAAAKKKILISSLLKMKIEDKVMIADDEIRAYYDGHSEEFMLPERWRASHILVNTEEEAEEVKERLKQGADFAELARQKSKDDAAKNGGDVGYFSKGQLIPEFDEACFKMEVGELSDIVKTKVGYHIIRLTDRKSPTVQEFSKVKDVIKKELSREQKKKLLKKLMDDLREKAKITINDELIADAPADDAPQD